MLSQKLTLKMIRLVVLALFLVPIAAFADDGELLRIRERMRVDIGLDDAGWKFLEPGVREHLNRGHHGDEVADLVRDLHAEGCFGRCLSEALSAYNGARRYGLSGDETRGLFFHELQEQHRSREHGEAEWDDFERGRRLRFRVEDRLELRFDDDRRRGHSEEEDDDRRRGHSEDDGRHGGDDGGNRGRNGGGGGKGRR